MKVHLTNLLDLAKWHDLQEQSLSGKAGNEKGAKQQYSKGQASVHRDMANMIRDGIFVLEPPTVKVVQEREEPKEERPAAHNNDFLRWVRQHYSPRNYQEACHLINNGASEEQVRKLLSGINPEPELREAND